MCDVASFSVPVSSSDPGAADKGLHWNSLPFGALMRILIRIHKNSPNGTEFQPAENGYRTFRQILTISAAQPLFYSNITIEYRDRTNEP